MSKSPSPTFQSKSRQRFFPVHSHEFPKFFSLNVMHIFIILNFWILHNLKDTLIVPQPESGSEVINYLKILGVFPASIIFVMLYSWLSNHLTQRTLFYGIMSSFMVFFALFLLVLHPNQDVFHMSPERLRELKEAYPRVQWFFPMIGYWIFSLLYVVSEMWSALILTFLFWQFANQITPVEQARRFYMLIGSFSAVGILGAGFATKSLKYFSSNNINGGVDFLIFLAFANCLLIMLIYRWMHRHVVEDSQHYHPDTPAPKSKAKEKIKMSLGQSFKHIFRSDYLIYIAILGIGYNVAINFVEVTWKGQLRLMYPNKKDYLDFMGDYNYWFALVMFFTGLLGVNIVRKFSWKTSAMVTPITVLITGALFFLMALYGEQCVGFFGFGFNAVASSCWIGLIQTLSAKSCKSCFFNATREMSYIPLDAELRVKGKAAVDVLSGRIGKMGGAGIQAILLSIIPAASQISIAPYLAICLFLIFLAWAWAVNRLNVRLNKLTHGTLDKPDKDV